MTLPNQTQPLSLPFHATCGKEMRVLLPGLLSSIVLAGIVFLYVLPMQRPANPNISPSLFPTVFGILAVLDGFLAVFMFRKLKPAFVEISRTTISVTPMPVLGFTYGTQKHLSPSDFSRIGPTMDNRNNPQEKVTLYGKEGTESLTLDVPKGMEPKAFAESIASLLNIAV